MNYYQLVSLLSDNMHPENWVDTISWDSRHYFTLREDISITIEEMPEREENSVSNEFTDRFLNKTASFYFYAVKYKGSIILNVCLYMVDGGRAFIPAPRGIADTHIEDVDLIVGVIIDRLIFDTRYPHKDTTAYLDRSGLAYQKDRIK